ERSETQQNRKRRRRKVLLQPRRRCWSFLPSLRKSRLHLFPHSCKTRRGVFARDTQIIIVLFAARSSADSSASRCSTSPEITAVSHVPHTPSSHAQLT